MKKKTAKSIDILNSFVQQRINIKIAVRISALLGFLVVGGAGIVQQVYAAQSVTEYCSQYSDSNDKNACKDGIRNIDCSAYLETFSFDTSLAQRTNLICKQAKKDHAEGVVSNGSSPSGTNTPSPTASPSTAPKPTSAPIQTPVGTPTDTSTDDSTAADQEKLDQAKDLEEYIDILHGMVKKADDALKEVEAFNKMSNNSDVIDQPDNNLGSYVNGANKQQPIITLNPGTGNSPAILFINGGGWHMNDGMGQNVAGTIDRGSGSMYDNTGAERAGDRGYAMYDVTYRLGSSGVYYMYEDVMRGIQHMRNNAAAYGIDPNRIVVWGDSAGGSLAMRATASGKSGAKVGVGWSAPTNAYTGLFRSIASLAVGIDHSTCIPTDIAGLANFADKFTGGDGNVAEYGQGLSSNDFSALGIGVSGGSGGINPLSLLTEGLVAGRYLLSAAADIEPITSQIKAKDFNGLAGSTINLASKTFTECIENFNAMSPALFASPDSPPSFLAGFENDGLVGPDQAYGMRDKLRQLGIRSEVLMHPGNGDCIQKSADIFGTGCHLGYYRDFVTPTLDFIDSVINNDWEPVGGGVDAITGGGSSGGPSINNSGGGSSKTKQKEAQCATIGSVYVSDSKNPDGGSCKSAICELFQSICENNFVSGKLNS